MGIEGKLKQTQGPCRNAMPKVMRLLCKYEATSSRTRSTILPILECLVCIYTLSSAQGRTPQSFSMRLRRTLELTTPPMPYAGIIRHSLATTLMPQFL